MPNSVLRNRLYTRLFLAYMAAISLPLLVFTVTGYLLTVRTARQEASIRSRNAVETAQSALEEELLKLSAIAFTIRGDAEISDLMATEEPLEILRVQRKITNYVEMNRLLSDIIYTDTESRRFYGSRSVYSAAAILAQYFDTTGIDSYGFHQALQATQDPGFLFLDRDRGPGNAFGYYAIPIYPYTDRKRVILFVIPRDKLEAKLLPGLDTRKASFFLVDDRNQTVIRKTDLAPAREAEAMKLLEGRFSEGFVGLQGYRCYASVLRTSDGRWRFVYLLGTAGFQRNLFSYFVPVLLSALALFLVETFIFRIFLRRNYGPVGELVLDILKPSSMEPAEIESAQKAIRALRGDFERAHAVDRLFSLLAGRAAPTGGDPVAETMAVLGIGGRGARCLPVLVEFSAPGAAIDPTAWKMRNGGCLVAPRFDRPGAVVLIHGDESLSAERLPKVLLELKQRLEVESGSSCCLTAGPLSASPEGLRQAYRSAQQSEELGFDDDGDGMILAAEQGDGTGAANENPVDELARLAVALEHGDIRSAHALFASLSAKAKTGAFPLQTARDIAAVAEFHLCGVPYAASPSLPVLTDGSSERLEARFRRILETLDRMGEGSGGCAEKPQPSRREILSTYVNAHWSDPAFSLKSLAETLGMSTSAASAYFTAAHGLTMVEYITHRRIELARTLLADGMPVKDVVGRVGYSDATSFIRKFRRVTGKTPGTWAKERSREREGRRG